MSRTDRTDMYMGEPDSQRPRELAPEERSPAALDEAILKASRRAVRYHWLAIWLERLRHPSRAAWQIVISLTLGALLALGISPFIDKRSDSLPAPIIHAGDPTDGLTVDPTYGPGEVRAPEAWLESIAGLLLDGRVAEAEAELRAFRERYPDYPDATPR